MASSTAPEDDLDFHPRHTSILLGQDAAEAELRRAWDSGRMPHAWLLAGPRGIGKSTLAYRFARAVLASTNGGALFGGGGSAELPAEVAADHLVFRRVAGQAHSDLCTVETGVTDKGVAREQIVVGDARAAVTFFAHTSAEGGWRVAIIDAADELNEESANALLKVVEEPPEKGLVLLVAHRPAFVLPTIRSRCRILRMKPLGPGDVARVLSLQWPELAVDDVGALMAMAEGSPGRAIALAQADGVGFYRDLLDWLGALPKMDVPLMHKIADRLARRELGRGFRAVATLPEWGLIRAIRAGAGFHPDHEVVPGEVEVLSRLVGPGNLDHWVRVWEKVSLLLARGIALNLERKQLGLVVLSTLGRAARG